MDHLDFLFPWIIVVPFFAFFAYRWMRYGGIKAAMFGAKIVGTTGEISLHNVAMVTTVLRVHVLGGEDPGKAVGIETVYKNPLSYAMRPMSLSRDQALQLATFLQKAASDSQLIPR